MIGCLGAHVAVGVRSMQLERGGLAHGQCLGGGGRKRGVYQHQHARHGWVSPARGARKQKSKVSWTASFAALTTDLTARFPPPLMSHPSPASLVLRGRTAEQGDEAAADRRRVCLESEVSSVFAVVSVDPAGDWQCRAPGKGMIRSSRIDILWRQGSSQ
ncbi:hypothetical protein GQ53DRAFT_443538 [Thozetella sp. PMI_491]|nr:hypothetical protein GQ53DRAFT_443538 [Thozetella sp. PMI_491]